RLPHPWRAQRRGERLDRLVSLRAATGRGAAQAEPPPAGPGPDPGAPGSELPGRPQVQVAVAARRGGTGRQVDLLALAEARSELPVLRRLPHPARLDQFVVGTEVAG